MAAETCTHLDQVRITALPESIAGCTSCGKIGCCDSSPNRHASRHAAEDAHPIARSAEPGESWIWCYVDEVGFELPE
jgi:hypothetical protein